MLYNNTFSLDSAAMSFLRPQEKAKNSNKQLARKQTIHTVFHQLVIQEKQVHKYFVFTFRVLKILFYFCLCNVPSQNFVFAV